MRYSTTDERESQKTRKGHRTNVTKFEDEISSTSFLAEKAKRGTGRVGPSTVLIAGQVKMSALCGHFGNML